MVAAADVLTQPGGVTPRRNGRRLLLHTRLSDTRLLDTGTGGGAFVTATRQGRCLLAALPALFLGLPNTRQRHATRRRFGAWGGVAQGPGHPEGRGSGPSFYRRLTRR